MVRRTNAQRDREQLRSHRDEFRIRDLGVRGAAKPRAVYFDPPPKAKDVWSKWVPAIVIEIVSERSGKRDYEDKPDEYLMFGVTEYWIVDLQHHHLQLMSRWRGQGQSKIFKPSQKITTPLLPGLTLDLKRVFAVAK